MKRDRKKRVRLTSRRGVWIAAAVVIGGLSTALVVSLRDWPDGAARAGTSPLELEDIPFNGARAYGYLAQLCRIGPRPSGSPGMAAQQELLESHFRKLGGTVHRQAFRGKHPVNGRPVEMANLIVQWKPQRLRRILLCAHYDTLPFPMLDKENPYGVFVGANDGGSGVAILMELAQEMPELLENDQKTFGVDFVFFDAEEFIFHRNHRYFVGSEYFALAYAGKRLPYKAEYRWGVLLDMVGDADLSLPMERNSLSWRDTRPLVQDIWATARRLGVSEFTPTRGREIRDDHLPLHNTGRIPTCNIIDFDYPPWHTQGDTLDKCSAVSLAKVGWVLREWLKTAEDSRR